MRIGRLEIIWHKPKTIDDYRKEVNDAYLKKKTEQVKTLLDGISFFVWLL